MKVCERVWLIFLRVKEEIKEVLSHLMDGVVHIRWQSEEKETKLKCKSFIQISVTTSVNKRILFVRITYLSKYDLLLWIWAGLPLVWRVFHMFYVSHSRRKFSLINLVISVKFISDKVLIVFMSMLDVLILLPYSVKLIST